MSTFKRDERRALEEAAGWFMRLQQNKVSEATIDEFFVWRTQSGNGAAYAEVEERMRQTERLRNDPELVRMTEAVLRRPSPAARFRAALTRTGGRFALAGLIAAGGPFFVGLCFRRRSGFARADLFH